MPGRYQIVAQLDPRTMQPIQQQGIVQQPQQTQQTQQTQQGGAQQFNVDRYAAESAADQMNWAASKGARLTMEDFEKARQRAWDEAMGYQRQQQAAKEQAILDIQKQQAQEGIVKRLDPSQVDRAAGYAAAADNIMQLYGMHQDAQNVPGYGKAVLGPITEKLYNITDPRVRALNANIEGTLTPIAKGVLGDAAVQSGEPSAQRGVRELLPNDQDDATMGGIKTTTLLQKVLTNMGDQIRGLKQNNYDTTAMQNDYTRIYNQYQGLVQNVGLKSQQEHPAASPDEVFGQAQQQFIAKGAQPIQPVVKAGLSQPSQNTISAVNAAASGQITATQAFQGQSPEQEGPWQLPQQAPATQDAQQAVASKQQQAQQLQQNIVSTVQKAPGAAIGWLQGLLPENWDPSAFEKPRPWETSSQQYVGTGQ